MGFELSERAKALSQKIEKNIQLLLRIEDVDQKYSTLPIQKFWSIGDPYVIGQTGLLIGGTIEDASVDPYIMLSGTTSQITQQLTQDKGGSSSISNMTIQLIDRDNAVSKSLNAITPDILSKRADVFLGYQQSVVFPDDYVTIFTGTIVDFDTTAGTVLLRISNPERLKNQEIFPKISVALNGGINDSVTTITLTDITGLLLPTTNFLTYVRIEDEVIQYTGISSSQLTGCTRGALSTTNVAHDDDSDVDSFYKLSGSPIDLSLAVMMSGGDDYYVEDLVVTGIVDESISNSIWFDDKDMIEYHNIVVGDTITIVDSYNPVINDKDWIIMSMGTTDTRSYFVVYDVPTGPFPEVPTTATASFKSQFKTLPTGCGMKNYEVDIDQHLKIKTLFGSGFPTMSFYLKETINAKEFLDSELLYPCGAYSLPRKGKVSCGYTAPPIAELNTQTLDQTNIIKPSSIKIKRSVDKNLYNSIVYKFEEDVLESRFLRGSIFTSETSQNRIRIGNKPLKIESKGLRKGAATDTFINAQSLRFLDRYKFGAESFEAVVDYGIGYSIEAGDSVIWNADGLQMFDSKNNSRSFDSRIMEVKNKSLSLVDGKVKLSLLDTSFSLDGRYATISPASYLSTAPAPTTTFLPLDKNMGTAGFEYEKWQGFIGQLIRVHSPDFTYDETTTLVGFDSTYKNAMVVTALPSAPSAGYIVTAPEYAGSTTTLWQLLHAYLNPYVQVASGTSGTVFAVGAGDIDKFFVGGYVVLNIADYSDPSVETSITDITGNTITVADDLGYTPTSSHYIDLIGFSDDNGLPYKYL